MFRTRLIGEGSGEPQVLPCRKIGGTESADVRNRGFLKSGVRRASADRQEASRAATNSLVPLCL